VARRDDFRAAYTIDVTVRPTWDQRLAVLLGRPLKVTVRFATEHKAGRIKALPAVVAVERVRWPWRRKASGESGGAGARVLRGGVEMPRIKPEYGRVPWSLRRVLLELSLWLWPTKRAMRLTGRLPLKDGDR